MLADILKKNDADNSGIRYDEKARTTLAFVTMRTDGEREFLFFHHPSADMRLEQSELDVDLIKKAKIFHRGFISFIDDPCRTSHLAVVNIAKKAKAFVSYDPNLRLAMWSSKDAA